MATLAKLPSSGGGLGRTPLGEYISHTQLQSSKSGCVMFNRET